MLIQISKFSIALSKTRPDSMDNQVPFHNPQPVEPIAIPQNNPQDPHVHPNNPQPVEPIAIPQYNPQDSQWPTMIAAGIMCPMCPPESAQLLNEGQLQRQYALALVQLNPCGHIYCTRCFELLLRASAQRRTRLYSIAFYSHFLVFNVFHLLF